jgi:hypothetical protein
MNNLKYFNSFCGYGEPPVPVGEISFADTATVPTYYLGWFGEAGQLLRFRKIAVTRRETRCFVLAEWTKPETRVCFAVENRLDEPIAWSPIPYDATEYLNEYYEGQVDSAGLGGEASRFERLVAFTEDYNDDSRSPQLAHAVLIATERSADPQLPAVGSARNETTRVAGVLAASRFARFESITTLTNSRTSDIRNQIRASLESVRNDEILLVYFSGHSLIGEDGDVLLSTGDTILDNVRNTSISMRMLAQEFSTCKGRIMLILDCCHSGSSSETEERKVIDAFRELHRSHRIAVVASRRLIENSTNALSGPLVRGLLGQADLNRDGIVGLDELVSFINRNLHPAPDFHWFVGVGLDWFSDLSPKAGPKGGSMG